MEGIIVKGVAGFYYVKTENEIYQCKARGLFRKDGIVPFVGDWVSIRVLDDNKAIIQEIHPRKNQFTRPPIANVDCLVIVMAVKKPEPNLAMMDRFLVMAEFHRTEILICINKIDLADEEGLQIYREIYDPIYPMIFVSGKTEQGIPLLKKYLRGRVSALAGPSGVGKSTLLNKMESKDLATVGEIGQKSQRGKHTTRHVELFDMEGGGMLFDTPGFTSFDVMDAEEGELAFLYPEMAPYIGGCRYDNCRHLSEPDCRIRKAVEEGKIHKFRYGSYMDQINQIQTMRRY